MSTDLTEAALEDAIIRMREAGGILLKPTTLIIPTIEQAQSAFEAGLEPYCPIPAAEPQK